MRPHARPAPLPALALALALVAGGCGTDPGTPDEDDHPSTIVADGPHAPADRRVAEPEVTTSDDRTRVRFDLGNIDVSTQPQSGEFVAPLRGTLTVPHETGTALPLVVVGHLRFATCADQSFRYPCPGEDSVRYDAGMDYLADALTTEGYAVLTPDLAPVFVGQDLRGAYDQQQAWTETVRAQLTALDRASAGGEAAALHGGADEVRAALGVLDTSRLDWVVHSRSGAIVSAAAATLAPEHGTRSIVYLASAHDLGTEDEPLSPPPLDVPSLGLVGSADGDVAGQAVRWAAAHHDRDRREPIAIGTVGAFGHTGFNQASAAVEDRVECFDEPVSAACPGPAQAQELATRSVVDWLRAVTHGDLPEFMVDAGTQPPATWVGSPVQWFVHTLGPRQVLVSADSARDAADPVVPGAVAGDGAAVSRCQVPAPMSPGDTALPCPGTGDVAVRPGPVQVLVEWTPGAAVRFAVPTPDFQPRTLVLHVTPFATPTDVDGVPVHLRYAGTTADLPPTLAGLRAHGDDDLGAMPTTVRVPLDPSQPEVDLSELLVGGLEQHPGPASGILLTGVEVAP